MKKITIILVVVSIAVIAAVALNGILSVSAQNESPAAGAGYVIVRATEVYGMNPSSLVVIYEDGTVEKSDLQKLNAKSIDVNLGVIHSKLNELKAKGYELVTSNGGNSDNIITSTFLFQKK